jgi:dinuclear metal center YbgI/SA1388 family protein
MIPKLDDVLTILNRIAPPQLAEPWDNSGLQVRSPVTEIRRIALALDPTLEAVRTAVRRGAQLLLTHHPLIFKPLARLDVRTYPGDVIFEALKGGISVVSAHTNLDAARGGVNDILADLFDLRDVEVLDRKAGVSEGVPRDMSEALPMPEHEGLGRIGNLPEPCPLSGLVETVKGILGAGTLKVVGDPERRVSRMAVLGGAGGSMVGAASKRGADVLLTGDVGHHHALEAASLGLALIDGGHFYTEKAALDVFAGFLDDGIHAEGWEVTVDVLRGERDPARVM